MPKKGFKSLRLERIERLIRAECAGLDSDSIDIGLAVAKLVLKNETVRSATMAGISTAKAQAKRRQALNWVGPWPVVGSKLV